MKKLLNLKEDGFTLVELMVVVAIIGVLSAIAVPNFKKYQAKSKTSEAKLQLSAAYTAEQSFYSDYDTYHVCLKYMGYNPVNEVASRYYAVGFNTAVAACATCDPILTQNGGIAGAGACGAGAGESIFAAGKVSGTGGAAITTFDATGAPSAILPDTFTLGAVGTIDRLFNAVNTASSFTIDQAKLIRQVRAGY